MAIHDYYSQQEIQFLVDNYSTMPWDELIDGINSISNSIRNKQSIRSKASSLGLRRKTAYGAYTQEEDAILREIYTDKNLLTKNYAVANEAMRRLPHRTRGSIHARAQKLGLKAVYPWTDDEDQFLVDNYYNMSVDELAEHLTYHNRTSVYNRITKLGLCGAYSFAYTDYERQFVTDNYQTMTDHELSVAIGRSVPSVKNLRLKLKLYRKDPEANTNYLSLIEFVQRNNSEWRKRSMRACNYKCVISGESFDEIHHLYAKNMIINKTLSKLKLPLDLDINTLSAEQKQEFLQAFFIEQDKYPLGVCLTKKLHHRFHVIYGFGNNTPEQFEEYIRSISQNESYIKIA